MPNDKSLQRLEALLKAFDSGAVQHDELIKAVDAVVEIVNENSKKIAQALNESDTLSKSELKSVRAEIKQSSDSLSNLIERVQNNAGTSVLEARKSLIAEIKRVEALIPTLPEETDLTGVFGDIEGLREELERLAILVSGENLRNALESLNGDDRLDRTAIKGLDDYEEISQLAKSRVNGRVGGGVSKNAVIALIEEYGGGGSSLPDQTGNSGKFLTTDGTDPSWATIPGGGDMLASVYDPAGGAEQVAFASELAAKQNILTEGAFVDGDKTKLNGIEAGADVTDTTNVTAAGALMDSEVTNLAAVKAFDPTDYATSAQGALADSAVQPGSLAPVATSGAYADLSGKPDLSVYDSFDQYANLASFPATGDVDVVYVAEDTGYLYRWTGSAYAQMNASLALGETSVTAYRGDRGKTAYDHSQLTTGNPHNVTKSDVGLGNVDNTSDADKPVSTAQQTALNLKANLASPTFTGVLAYESARGKITAGGNLGATETINFNSETDYKGTLDSNITFTFAGAVENDEVTLWLLYDGSAQRTITWPTISWANNSDGTTAPTTPAASGNMLIVTIKYIGGVYYGSATGTYAVYA